MGYHVALTCNLIDEDALLSLPVDSMAGFDMPETIESVKRVIESGGHAVMLIEADETAYSRLLGYRESKDIGFNIAEGTRGESRESHIPCMLEQLGIHCVGSGLLTLALTLNKYRTKEILAFHGISTPAFQVLRSADGPLDPSLRYPLIVKLLCEGSSIGLAYDSVVSREEELRTKTAFLFDCYALPVIVEEFLTGREFTVPIIGNDPPVVLPIIEILFFGEKPINLFVPDKHFDVFDRIDPGYWFPRSARARGMEYDALILQILDMLDAAMKRKVVRNNRVTAV